MFAGILVRDRGIPPGAYIDEEPLLAALDPYRQDGASGAWHEKAALLAQTGSAPPLRCPESGIVAAFWGRLDNRVELLAALGLPPGSSDQETLLAAYLRWRENCPERLVGDFAFAIIDPHQDYVFLARDPMGVKPLYYLADDRFFAFATAAAVFTQLKIGRPLPDMDWAARYLADLTESHTATAYLGVLKLPPGHCLKSQSGKILLRKYFEFSDDAQPTKKRSESRVESYREILEESVRCRLDTLNPMGFENSGGLDSSTVIGCAARHSSQPLSNLHCFSFAFLELEPEYMMETSRYCGIVNNHVITQLQIPDEDIYERGLRMNAYPLEWISGQASPAFFYRLSQKLGIRSFFSGFGGDECVTDSGYLSRYELLANHQYLALWDNLPGNPLLRTLRYAKTVGTHLRQPQGFSPPLHEAMKKYCQLWILRDDLAQNLRGQYMGRARYDAPFRRVNDFILQDRFSPQLTTRLENSTMLCRAYGMDYCAPLLDTRLIQQYLSTPAIEKAGPGGMGRYLHRRAVEGLISPKVQWNGRLNMGNWGFKQGWYSENLRQVAEIGTRELHESHPAVKALIDGAKLSHQIERAMNGVAEHAWGFQFRRNILKLRWLNRWLNSR